MAALALVLRQTAASPSLYLYAHAKGMPAIRDISTDTVDPPPFVAVLSLRQGARNTVDVVPDTLAQ